MKKSKIDPKTKKALIDYATAVAASAVALGIALISSLRPEYAILVGALAAPAVKWSTKHSKEYGRGAK